MDITRFLITGICNQNPSAEDAGRIVTDAGNSKISLTPSYTFQMKKFLNSNAYQIGFILMALLYFIAHVVVSVIR